MKKDFQSWHTFKDGVHHSKNAPTFREREIWWTSIGLNIGYEQDGKNKDFNRPVLILKKFNNRIFWGIPLSTKIKDNPFYHPITFKGNKQSVILSQLRLYDAKRLTDKMGRLPQNPFKEIKQALKDLL